MEDIDGGLHRVVDGQSLDEDVDEDDIYYKPICEHRASNTIDFNFSSQQLGRTCSNVTLSCPQYSFLSV